MGMDTREDAGQFYPGGRVVPGGTPVYHDTVKANAATGAAHAGTSGNPHGTTWAQVTGKPSSFPPSAHPHDFADINKPLSYATDVFDMESSDWVLRKKVAELYALLGGKVINND